jgi:hypothetical protein
MRVTIQGSEETDTMPIETRRDWYGGWYWRISDSDGNWAGAYNSEPDAIKYAKLVFFVEG